ncbi:MAG: septum formation protein Maf [Bacteroidia bacterium]|nr:septum formation protein Maf [Bacteroidia bacterium]
MKLFEPYTFILASESPRRKALLHEMGIKFESVAAAIDESIDPDWSNSEAAEQLAMAKAASVPLSSTDDQTLVIAADTIVCVAGRILGKPANAAEAREMFTALSGNAHQVLTGVCIRSCRKSMVFHSATHVVFAPLTAEEIAYYVAAYRPLDKAGAYGIQEWIGLIGIQSIAGSYFNVMGLPTHRLYEALKDFIGVNNDVNEIQ